MLQVVKQLSEQALDTRLVLIFNSQIETNVARFETIRYLGPNFEQAFAALPYAKDKHSTASQYKKALNQFVADNFNSSHITYAITTLFSFDVFAEYPDDVRKALVFYDLIPLMNWKDLGGYFPPHLYMSRFERIYESDIVYCISETTRQDVLNTFCIDPKKAVNINGGFTEHHLDAVKPVAFEVPKKYILFPTGNLPHKNNQIVFQALKKVLVEHKDVHLLVTSAFSEEAKEKLLNICNKNVIFTQNVTDEELQYLYKNASMVLFASKYEGLGLPVLDAVFHEKPIVASSISVFKEMSENAFFYFDMNDSNQAATAISQALDKKNFKAKVVHYPAILSKYDWKKVGGTILSHLDGHKAVDRAVGVEKPEKIAIVSLNPGIEGTIGRLSEQLYGRLRGVVSVSYFFDSCGLRHKDMERPTFLDHLSDTEVYDLKRLSLREYRKFDRVFYLLDGKSTNFMIMEYAVSLPGGIIYDQSIDGKMAKVVMPGAPKRLSLSEKEPQPLDKLKSFILQPIKLDKRMRILKSHLPKRVKYEYLKKEMKVSDYGKAE
jgi:glycosyltransferase involved in cell wall biosynthesis